MKMKNSYRMNTAVYSILFAMVLVVFNYILFNRNLFYFDTTEQKVFTPAPQTIQVASSLEYPLEISAFFLGGKTDDFKLLGLLQKIAKMSDKISWKVVDPEKNPILVEKYGIRENKTLHFLYRNESDSVRETQISQVLNEQAIVNAILKLVNNTQKKVYYIVGHGELDLESENETGYSAIAKSIAGEGVQLEMLNLAEAGQVPEDADAIMLATPQRQLPEGEFQAILDYLHKGTGIILGSAARTASGAPTVSSAAELAKHFGIIVGNDIIVEPITRGGDTIMLGVQPVITSYAPHLITRGFREGIAFNLATSVTRDAEFVRNNKGVIVAELAFTSANSWAESKVDLIFADNPSASFSPDEDIKGPVPVVATYENTPESEAKPTRLVVIGDGSFVNNVNVRQLYNRDFFLNALNWTLGNWKGITIRSGTMRESKNVLTQKQFDYMFAWSVIVAPLIIILIGLWCWLKRRH